MNLREFKNNLTASLVSKSVRHTTPNLHGKNKGSIEKKAEVKPKGMFEKLDHPAFHSAEQRAKLDRLNDLYSQTHQKMQDAQRMGLPQDVSKHREMLNKIKADDMKRKEMYRREKSNILSKNVDV